MMYSNTLKSRLEELIIDVSMNSDFYRNPNSDFTRSRKLDFITTFNSILSMGGSTLNQELLDLFNWSDKTPTKSAFVQARNKIRPEAFSHVFYEFNKSLRKQKKYRGYNLLAVDGSRINIFRDPNDSDSHVARSKGKGFNSLSLSAMYDLLNSQYTDAVIQGINSNDERGALINMIPKVPNKSILILDRGYESYNVISYLENYNSNYLIRVKDISSTGISSSFGFPDEEFDEIVTVNVSNFQSKKLKQITNYRFSPSCTRFDFSNKLNPVHTLTFRIIRVRVDDDKYQCLITNLSDSFSPSDLKYLYKLRWGIETSFRELKYSIGLVNFHAKKKDSIIQEIYARLTLHNFCKSIVQNIVLHNRNSKHDYKIDFVMAVHICRQFLRLYNTILLNVETFIIRYLSVVRHNRSFERIIKTQTYKSFVYRVS